MLEQIVRCDELHAKKVFAETVVVRHPHGDGDISLIGMKDGAGLWINRNGASIALFNLANGQLGVGIYPSNYKGGGTPICLAVDDDGAGFIQFVDKDGRIRVLRAEDVPLSSDVPAMVCAPKGGTP